MAFREKSRLPQRGYFSSSHRIPGTAWTLTGHSRSLERTGFWIPELRCCLDAGVDLPTDSGAHPLAVLVTHGHIDHCNALPMLLRHRNDNDPPMEIFAPAPIVHRLRSFAQLSWAVKVDIGDDLPSGYAPPSEDDQNPTPGVVLEGDLPHRLWRPSEAGSITEISLGKKANTVIVVRSLKLFHGMCSSVGFLLATPARTVNKLRPDLIGETKKETGMNIRAAKERGEEVNVQVEEPEKAHFAYVLDTTIEALDREQSATASEILNCPVIMIECTFLEDSMKEEARKRAHTSWGELVPFVAESVRRRKEERGWHQTWYLVHFSLRYFEEQIVDFFEDEEQSKLSLVSPDSMPSRPPDVVLWLDSGPKELWIDDVLHAPFP